MPTSHWLKPAAPVAGQDHLASKAVCENIYARLLPGITNVTDRARYFSLYPWLLWAMHREGRPLDKDSVITTIRRADCLLTLVGEWHGRQTGGAAAMHGDRMVGRDTLTKAVDTLQAGHSVRLSTYSGLSVEETGKRYFKNPLGGLGQYYLGPLSELGVLGREEKAGISVGYTAQAGQALAQAVDVDRQSLFAALDADEVDVSRLAAFSSLCPCGLAEANTERQALTDLFFFRPGPFQTGDGGEFRRRSLGLILDLAGRLEEEGHALTLQAFRGAVYTRALLGGASWTPPAQLEEVRRGWAVYQRNELLSLAMQTLFWAGLVGLHQDREGRITGQSEFGAWFAEHYAAALRDVGQTFRASVQEARTRIPPLETWEAPGHELRLAEEIQEKARGVGASRKVRTHVVSLALDVLCALAARDDGEQRPYGALEFGASYFNPYPINLASFRELSRGTWAELSGKQLLSWLAGHWCMGVHLRVALRKLRFQGKDTFRIRPTEEGFLLTEYSPTAEPGYGQPRFRQATQVLRDLGALAWNEKEKGYVRTGAGTALWEEVHG